MYIDFSSFFDQSLREVSGFYPARSHEQAFLRISDGINHQHSVFFLQGSTGVGKTHILKRLYRKPESSLRKAWLSVRQPSIGVIMQSFADLYETHWDIANRNVLRKRLVADVKNKKMPVLYIDNVTSLDVETVIALSNILRWRKHTIGKVVFSGRFRFNPVFKSFVKHNNIKAMHCRLKPLDEAEIHAYLVQLSRASGYAGKSPFDKDSIRALIKHSQGIPHKINQLCDCCLFIARNSNHFKLDANLVNQAAADLQKLRLWSSPNNKKLKKEQLSSSDVDFNSNPKIISAIPVSKQTSALSISKTIVFGGRTNTRDHFSQGADKNHVSLKGESQFLSDEWEKALNSYLLKHPNDENGNNNVDVSKGSRGFSYSKIWPLTSLLLLLIGAGGGYYFLNHVNYTRGNLPDDFSPWHSKNVNDNINITKGLDKTASKTESKNIIKGESIESSLVLAVWNNKIAEINELLQLGVNVNTRNHFGQTPLMIAAILGNLNAVKLLLENGAALNYIDNNGLTALMLSARNGQLSVAELLLGKGADVNVQDKRGLTALMHAASFGHETTVETILKYKPALEVKDNKSKDKKNIKEDEGRAAGTITLSQGYQNIAQIIQTTL